MKNGKMRRLFVSATKQNDGKTSCSLGLVKGFENLASVGFIKPVGQRYVTHEDVQVDEDAVLVYQACKLSCSLKQMNPVVIPQYFTRQYLEDPDSIHPRLVESIETSFAEISKDKDLMVIEGTGHAGVGSVFDLSNARVAKLLGAKAVIVTLGGIGQPIDEVTVNLSLFEKEKGPKSSASSPTRSSRPNLNRRRSISGKRSGAWACPSSAPSPTPPVSPGRLFAR